MAGLRKEVDSNTLRVKGLGAFEILEVTLETTYGEEEEKTREHELRSKEDWAIACDCDRV